MYFLTIQQEFGVVVITLFQKQPLCRAPEKGCAPYGGKHVSSSSIHGQGPLHFPCNIEIHRITWERRVSECLFSAPGLGVLFLLCSALGIRSFCQSSGHLWGSWNYFSMCGWCETEFFCFTLFCPAFYRREGDRSAVKACCRTKSCRVPVNLSGKLLTGLLLWKEDAAVYLFELQRSLSPAEHILLCMYPTWSVTFKFFSLWKQNAADQRILF